MDSIVEILKDWGGWVAAAIVSMFALRGSIKFDVNQWLRDRREARREKAQMLCPHARFDEGEQGARVRSLLVSPAGRADYVCEWCGTEFYSEETAINMIRRWAKNPKALVERLEKYREAVKKLHG